MQNGFNNKLKRRHLFPEVIVVKDAAEVVASLEAVAVIAVVVVVIVANVLNALQLPPQLNDYINLHSEFSKHQYITGRPILMG